MANALARYLPCFESETPTSPFVLDSRSAVEIAVAAEPVNLFAEAEERGRLAGYAAANAAFEAIRADDSARFEHDLAVARRNWTDSESERLAEQFRHGFSDLEAAVAAEVAQILSGFVAAAVAEQALGELAAMLADLLGNGKPRSVQVSGPEDLLEALRRRLGERADSLSFVVAGQPDIRVVLDETVIETQLEAWRARLTAAVI